MLSPIIISLGGSIVAPDGIDTGFIRSFQELIKKRVSLGESFVVIVGGGKMCRRYQEAAKELGAVSQEAQDWVGIYATRLNAELMRVVFGDMAHHELVLDPKILHSVSASVVIGAGWKPGHSTDFDAILMAEHSGAKRAINLSNINYAYDKDPKKFPDTVKLEKIGWEAFRKILPSEWSPGINAPFDPVAAKRAEELGVEVAIMNGNNLENLESYLEGKAFKGTVIS